MAELLLDTQIFKAPKYDAYIDMHEDGKHLLLVFAGAYSLERIQGLKSFVQPLGAYLEVAGIDRYKIIHSQGVNLLTLAVSVSAWLSKDKLNVKLCPFSV